MGELILTLAQKCNYSPSRNSSGIMQLYRLYRSDTADIQWQNSFDFVVEWTARQIDTLRIPYC